VGYISDDLIGDEPHSPLLLEGLRRSNRDKRSQTSIEYVLVVLAVVLFLSVAAAAAMTGVLGNAVTLISTWINSVNPPAVP